jgi:hypothetical protein
MLHVAFKKVIDFHPCFSHLIDSLEFISIYVFLHPCYIGFFTIRKHKLVCEIHGKCLTDVPFGMLLSGGLDSSLVVIVASQHLNNIEVANVWGAQFHIFLLALK